MSRLPESPRFLLHNGDEKAARNVLSMIRSSQEEIDGEISQIKETAKEESQAAKNINFATLFSKKYRYLVIAGVGVATFQQFQGANAIFYYIPLIVEKATGSAASSALM